MALLRQMTSTQWCDMRSIIVHTDVESLPFRQRQSAPPVPTPFVLKDVNLRVPDIGRKFVQMKHDFDVLGQPRSFGYKYAFPAVVNKNWGLLTKYADQVYDYVEIPDVWAKFFWDFWNWASGYKLPVGKIESFYTKTTNTGVFARATLGSLTQVYIDMIEKSRSHTDSYSPEVGARDIMTGRNLENKKRWQWLFRPTTGQMGMVKADRGTYWELEALDILKPPPSMSVIENSPWLWGWATEATPVGIPPKPYTKWVVSGYPQIEVAFRQNGWLEKPGTPIPFLSKGGSILIKKFSCVELTPGTRWSPYVPEK